MSDHDHHPAVNYFLVFVALIICTALSVVFDLVKIESKAVVIVLVLSVAVAKALFVLTFFMHLKFEGKWKFVLLAPTTILAIGLPLALLPDIGVHYYETTSPQARYAQQYKDLHAHDGEHQGEHHTGDDHQGGAETE